MILCDIGNTTFHFLVNGKHEKYLLNDEIPKFDEKVFYISVNEKASSKLLVKNHNAVNLRNFLDLDTEYKGLGIDRALGFIFAQDEVIVDAGSAITVDVMENSKHKGGFILPGIRAFENAYGNISKKLSIDFEKNVNLDKIPLQTKDAISYAILKAIILPIKEISKDKQIILTGGDGKILKQYFENSIYKKDLIFENMKRIIDANNCIA